MTLKNRINNLEQTTSAEKQDSNVVIFDPNIPGDAESKESVYRRDHHTGAVVLIPDNGRPRSELKPDDNKPS